MLTWAYITSYEIQEYTDTFSPAWFNYTGLDQDILRPINESLLTILLF